MTSETLVATASMTALAERVAAALTTLVDGGDRPDWIRLETRRPDGHLAVVPQDGEALTFDYADWHDDLGTLPRRKLVLWSKALCAALFERLTHRGFSEALTSFVWLGRPIACHHDPHWSSAQREVIGDVESVVHVRSGTVVFGHSGVGILGRDGTAVAHRYSDVRHAKLSTNKLSLTVGGDTYAFDQVVVYESDPDRRNDFDWRLLVDRLPAFEVDRYDADQLRIPEDVVASLREKADPVQAIGHYVAHKQDRAAAARVAADALTREPHDLMVIEAIVPSLLRLGRAEEVLTMFEPVRQRCLGTDSRYIGNLVGHVVVAYAYLGRADEGGQLVRDSWVDDASHVPRIYYFNGACLSALAGDYEMAQRAVEGAFARGNALDDFENESDLDALRARPEYQEFARRVAGAEPGPEPESFGPDDGRVYVEDYRRRPNPKRLYDIAVTGPPDARALFESLIEGPHVDGDTVQSAFYSLIALGDEQSLARAAALHSTADERCNMLDFFLDGKGLARRLPDPDKFRRDVARITGEELDD